MSFDDDAAGDPAGFRPPPHPDDRLWRHPSELHSSRHSEPDQPERTVRYNPWETVAVAAAGVMLLTAGASLVVLGLRERAATPALQEDIVSPLGSGPGDPLEFALANRDDPDTVQLELAQALAPSVVRVDSGTTRGSGVVLREDGVMLTSADVVGDRSSVAVALSDGRLVTGEIVGVDHLTGLAVVDLPGDGYDIATPASTLSSTPGAVGFAIGVDETGRVVAAAGDLASTAVSVERTDLPRLDGVLTLGNETNPVSRGGPVVDEDGAVVGLTTWTDEDHSYVVPLAVAEKVLDDLVDTGAAHHTWLGIEGYDEVEGAVPAGIVVAGVLPEGPSAGVLQIGDVIVALDGHPALSMSALVVQLRSHDPGDEVVVAYRRQDSAGTATETQTDAVVLAPRPPDLDQT